MKNTKLIILVTHLFCMLGLIFASILPKNKYEWMSQLEANSNVLPADETAGIRMMMVVFVLLAVAVTELVIAVKAEPVKRRIFPVIMFLFSILLLIKWF